MLPLVIIPDTLQNYAKIPYKMYGANITPKESLHAKAKCRESKHILCFIGGFMDTYYKVMFHVFELSLMRQDSCFLLHHALNKNSLFLSNEKPQIKQSNDKKECFLQQTNIQDSEVFSYKNDKDLYLPQAIAIQKSLETSNNIHTISNQDSITKPHNNAKHLCTQKNNDNSNLLSQYNETSQIFNLTYKNTAKIHGDLTSSQTTQNNANKESIPQSSFANPQDYHAIEKQQNFCMIYSSFNCFKFLRDFISNISQDGYLLSVIAHSWGAKNILRLCLKYNFCLQNLITLDCVGHFTITHRPSNILTWENIYITDYYSQFSRPNLAAIIGGGKQYIQYADFNIGITPPAHHASVIAMLAKSKIFGF